MAAELKIRLLFRAYVQALKIFFAGNHDEVRRLIRLEIGYTPIAVLPGRFSVAKTA